MKVKDGLYFHGPVIQELKARMQAWFGSHDDLDPAGFKELSGGLSRKYVIPLLEYFDRERVTIRVGDKRQFRGRGREKIGGGRGNFLKKVSPSPQTSPILFKDFCKGR